MRKITILIVLFLLLFTISIYNSFSLNNKLSFIYPTSYTSISSTYGFRILYGVQNFHNGIDFLAPLGSEIFASNSGIIEHAGFLESGYGNTVIINHGNGYKTLYCHMDEDFIVHIGDYVTQGQIIGFVGPKYLSNGIMNGNTTGPHLHFSVFYNNSTINPLDVLN